MKERLQDLAALTVLFTEFGCAQTVDEIRVFARHHTLPELIAFGWLEKSAPCARWGLQLYAIAGELKAAIHGDSQLSAQTSLHTSAAA